MKNTLDDIGLRPNAYAKLAEAKQRGFITPQEITELFSPTLFSDRVQVDRAFKLFAAWCAKEDIAIFVALAEKEEAGNETTLQPPLPPAESSGAAAEALPALVAECAGITQAHILGKRRPPQFSLPRQIAMYLLREDFGMSFPNIARLLQRDNHTTAIHGYRHIMVCVLKNTKVRDIITKVRARYANTQTETTAPVQLPAETAWEKIAKMVIETVSAQSGMPIEKILEKKSGPKPEEDGRTTARHLAIYLLDRDFEGSGDEIAVIFGIKNRSSVPSICTRFERRLKKEVALRTRIAKIRAEYSLALYDSHWELFAKRQKELFPKQREEAGVIVGAHKDRMMLFEVMVDSLDIRERHREIFKQRYGLHDDSFRHTTYEQVGKAKEGITRARVWQILKNVWDTLRQNNPPPEFVSDEEVLAAEMHLAPLRTLWEKE